MRWRWPDQIGFLVALGLVPLPWLAGFAEVPAAAASASAIGILALACFGLSLPRPAMWKGWANLGLALALMLAPFFLGFTGIADALWAHWIAGFLLGLAALWSLARTGQDRPPADGAPP